MSKYTKYNYLLRNIVLGTIFINLITSYKDAFHQMLTYLGIFLIILINDYIRHKFSISWKSKWHNASLLASIIAGAILVFLARDYTSIYMIMIIYEIVTILRGNIRKLFLTLHIAIFLYVTYFYEVGFKSLVTRGFWLDNGMDLIMILSAIAFYTFLLYFYEYQAKERRKTEKLNKELKESYNRLQEYSKKVEDLTIIKERNRVAQEIHDSLGHNMTALIMNLDYIEKILDIDPSSVKDLVAKCQRIARNSMTEVRNAVYTLKEKNVKNELLPSIHELIDNLSIDQGVRINLDIKGHIGDLTPHINGIIYRTIQEGLTNAIKHGEASLTHVVLNKGQETLKLVIKDNGEGCETISKGNGLRGIEERINSVKGTLKLKTALEMGFEINITIPLKEIGGDSENG